MWYPVTLYIKYILQHNIKLAQFISWIPALGPPTLNLHLIYYNQKYTDFFFGHVLLLMGI